MDAQAMTRTAKGGEIDFIFTLNDDSFLSLTATGSAIQTTAFHESSYHSKSFSFENLVLLTAPSSENPGILFLF